MTSEAEAIRNRVLESDRPYAVFVRGATVTWAPEGSIALRKLRARPELAALEVGVFDRSATVEEIDAAIAGAAA